MEMGGRKKLGEKEGVLCESHVKAEQAALTLPCQWFGQVSSPPLDTRFSVRGPPRPTGCKLCTLPPPTSSFAATAHSRPVQLYRGTISVRRCSLLKSVLETADNMSALSENSGMCS